MTSNMFTDETARFIVNHNLEASIAWLRTIIPLYFDGSNYEIDLLPSEEGKDNLLSLKIYNDYTALEFRERRHGISKAILDAGYRDLFIIICIFQRRT